MNQPNWNNIKIRCSSLSCLFTEPQSKAAKEAGELSQTAKTHLIQIYARELWGVEKDLLTKQMQKGREAEQEAITMLSLLDGTLHLKNEEEAVNEFIRGHADIVEPSRITDTKCSWDAFTFLPKLTEEIDKTYFYQLQGYMWLWDKPSGRVSYLLVDTPENIIQGEKYRLLRSMDVVSEESPEYLREAARLESNMKFSHIPMELRAIHHYVERDEDIIAKIPQKVQKAREFLKELHEKHLSLYKN